MKFTSIDEKIKELICEGITDELSDHLADVFNLIEDKFESTGLEAKVASAIDNKVVAANQLIDDKFGELNDRITTEIDEYVNTNKFKGYLAGIVAAEIQEQFKKLPSDYVITLLCAALTRLGK